MSGGTRIPREAAQALADELVRLLGPCCERLWWAGSLRRGEPSVGDIELVAIPYRVQAHDLFGNALDEPLRDELHERVTTLRAKGVLEPRLNKLGRPSWGPSLKLMVFKGVGVDLTSTDADRWGCTLLIRTGPAAFSNAVVTSVDKVTRRGDRGLLPRELRYADWRLINATSGALLQTPEEGDVLRALGLNRWPPEARAQLLEARRRAAGVG